MQDPFIHRNPSPLTSIHELHYLTPNQTIARKAVKKRILQMLRAPSCKRMRSLQSHPSTFCRSHVDRSGAAPEMSAKAKAISCARKKIGDQAKLRTAWRAYRHRGRAPAPFFQTSQEAYPIAPYSTVQTGPKSQLGGDQLGFFNVLYLKALPTFTIVALQCNWGNASPCYVCRISCRVAWKPHPPRTGAAVGMGNVRQT